MKRFRYIFQDTAGEGGGAGGTGSGAGVAATGTESSSWYSSFSTPELRGVVENKGWKSPEDAVKSYSELQRLVGVPKERLLTLPEKDDDAEGWNSIYQRLGRPEKMEDYGLDKLQNSDPEYAKAIAEVMHRSGVSKKQAQSIVEGHTKFLDGYLARQAEAQRIKNETETQQLRTEWADQYQPTVERGGQAVKELWGDQADTIMQALQDKLGVIGAAKAIAKLADKAGEGTFRTSGEGTGGNSGMGYSPDGAKAEVARLKADPEFQKSFINGDVSARQKLSRLMQIAYPGSQGSNGLSSDVRVAR
jgi:hypothetical protein